MSIFGKILSGLGLGTSDESSVKAPSAGAKPTPASPTPTTTPDSSRLDALLDKAAEENRQDPSLHVSPKTQTDVTARFDDLVKASGQPLNWRTSIVDLLKVLNLDSSLESRKALALELGCPNEKLADSAQMNIWLHQAVMKKIAENGGQVPSDLKQ